MSHSFFCFQSLKYVSQPSYSYWCWAACLEQMIKGLNAKSKIGTKQCELASTYKDIKENHPIDSLLIGNINNYKSSNCCSASNKIPNGCNIALEENDLKSIFGFSGFNATEIKDCNSLKDFGFIKQTLIDNQSPIVLKVRKNGKAHMNIISGYGKLNGCEYLLISDPLESIGETYQEFSGLINPREIDRVWITKLGVENLEHDAYLEKSLEIVNDFINKFLTNIEHYSSEKGLENSALSNPWKYLANKDPLYVAQSIKEFMSNEKLTIDFELFNFFDELTYDSDVKNLSSCEQEINKDLVVYTDINFINQSFLDESTQKDINTRLINKINKGNALSYIKDFATSIEIKVDDDTIMVKPINYPKDYEIKNEWTTYEVFKNQISINPKIVYFNEDLNTRPSQKIKLSIN
ncbi:hypothetical protein [Psychroserpens luteus]|uniref:Papain-like cysteine protease AvrRpt2 n=1 Tax=Psychroserpens luteus TaxID=1434066 RepID=A0ABW5ZPD1_9FLAO|nr:hypothetical protein [Psychroserpens luteus]